MNILDLKNNAMFLACWREKMRPVLVICFLGLILGAVLLSYLGILSGEVNQATILTRMFYVFVAVQAIIIVAMGALSVAYMGSRERTSGTLDFHRNSPQAVGSKIMGLVLGSTALEWMIFLAVFLAEVPLALAAGIPPGAVVMFNCSLAVTAVFFHVLAAVVSLVPVTKRAGSPLIVILVSLWFLPQFMFMAVENNVSLFSYFSGFCAIRYIAIDQSPLAQNGLFGSNFPDIVIQLFAQVPLVIILFSALRRIFRKPNSPALSKKNTVRLIVFLLLITTGFFISEMVNWKPEGHWSRYMDSNNPEGQWSRFMGGQVAVFVFEFLLLGMAASFFLVPTYLKFSKRLVLKNVKKITGCGFFDDGASGLPFLLIYIGVAGILFGYYVKALQVGAGRGGYAFLLLSSYVMAFGSFLEYYRLSPFRYKKIFFASVLLAWWVLVPGMLSIQLKYEPQQPWRHSLSPFGGAGHVISVLSHSPEETTRWDRYSRKRMTDVDLKALVLPLALAGAFCALAWRQRRLVRCKAEE